MSAPGWLTTLFCPMLGVLISNAVGLAPVRAVLEARKRQELGVLSPIPFALITNSCLGWVMYGVFKGDFFIFFSNCFSLVVGFSLCLTAIHILEKTVKGNGHEDSVRIKVESILVISACFWLFLIFITGIVMRDPVYSEERVTVLGAFCVVSSLIFYGAPLINMVEIVKNKDSSSLYAPALVINGINCLLWFSYGLFGIHAVIVWLPNIIGMTLVAVELGLCCIYTAKDHSTNDSSVDKEPMPDYAVYSSSRHMSSADTVFPTNYVESQRSRKDRANSIIQMTMDKITTLRTRKESLSAQDEDTMSADGETYPAKNSAGQSV